ncbi:MAG: hypothetical protein V1717_03925 [Candidatus Micrarchaeota archaeon]
MRKPAPQRKTKPVKIDPEKHYELGMAKRITGLTYPTLYQTLLRLEQKGIPIKYKKLPAKKKRGPLSENALLRRPLIKGDLLLDLFEKAQARKTAESNKLLPLADAWRLLPRKPLRQSVKKYPHFLKFVEEAGLLEDSRGGKFISRGSLQKAIEYLDSLETHYNLPQAAGLLGVGKSHLIKVRKNGGVPSLQLGSHKPLYPRSGLVSAYAWVFTYPSTVTDFFSNKMVRNFNEHIEYVIPRLGVEDKKAVLRAFRSVTRIPLGEETHFIRLYNISERLANAVETGNVEQKAKIIGLLKNFSVRNKSWRKSQSSVLQELERLHTDVQALR